ncbi:MAG: DUF3459 domain-containing protein, partial [Pseudolabrys sp.]|nr:DUF3459 domain-containing protein [Pseudolabrys sp.]
PPNNWLSEFGGSVWQFDPDSGQYYHHAFLSSQPDLNWRNPAVREAKHEVMRFWLRRGVDGFRVDVMWHLIKDDLFRDDPENVNFREGDPPHRRFVQMYSADQPEVYNVVRGLRKVVDEFPERLLIGEIYLPLERLVAYYIGENDGAHMPFNFSLIETPWTAHDIVALIDRYEGLLPQGAWPNWVLGNHDRPRLAARIGERQARIAAMLLLTLRGTPTLYYGDEIGLPQVDVPAGRLHDPVAFRVPAPGRDGCRTPMQWDHTPHAGFSTMTPWLPQSEDVETRNVEVEFADPASLLNLYRRLIAVRRAHPALVTGSYKRIKADKGLLTFLRQQDDESFLVALNLSGEPVTAILPDDERGMVLVSALADREGQVVAGRIELAGDEGVVVKLH